MFLHSFHVLNVTIARCQISIFRSIVASSGGGEVHSHLSKHASLSVATMGVAPAEDLVLMLLLVRTHLAPTSMLNGQHDSVMGECAA